VPADEKDWRPVTVQALVAAILYRIKAARPHACARQILSRTSRPGRYDKTRELHIPRQVQNASGSMQGTAGLTTSNECEDTRL